MLEITIYECLMCKERYCLEKARNEKDLKLRIFYLNAATGFQLKRKSLSLAEAGIKIV